MSSYVLARGVNGSETYFCVRPSGYVWESPFWTDAVKFHDYDAALECAQTHRKTRNSEEWRVMKLVDRGLRLQ